MPVKDGHEAFSEMKMINKDLKVILSSGYSSDKQIHQTINSGAYGLISKPFNFAELATTISECLKS